MKSLSRNQHGYSMAEMLITAALFGGVMIGLAQTITPIREFIESYHVRRKATTESRVTIETVMRLLRTGKPETVEIDSPEAPNSRVRFTGNNGSTYEIYLSNQSVYLKQDGKQPKRMAANVTSFMITMDFRDPSLLSVNLRLDAPYGRNHSRADESLTILLANQVVRVGSSL